ncbi:predicted protein [Histoplasma capsulatum H143]|uniref:Uncharacterized protein n=1 Tax=Ajellomyces capsulatus (strain H143) TaxID=544712 RepID=C6H7I6_AJECH|nr:predicted protein [Histoplasma capsulatum H143]
MHLFSPFNSPDWRCKKFPTLTKTPKADSGNYRWLRMKDQNIPTTAKAEASTWIEFRPPFLYLLQRKYGGDKTPPSPISWVPQPPNFIQRLANPAIHSPSPDPNRREISEPRKNSPPILFGSEDQCHCRFPTSPKSGSTSRTAVDRPWPGLASPPTHTGEDRVA